MCMKKSLNNGARAPCDTPCPPLGICTCSSFHLGHTFLPCHSLFIHLIWVRSRSLQLKDFFLKKEYKFTNIKLPESFQSPSKGQVSERFCSLMLC